MEDREMPQMHKYGESKTTWIMLATVHHMTFSSGLRKFQAACFCRTECTLTRGGFILLWIYTVKLLCCQQTVL